MCPPWRLPWPRRPRRPVEAVAGVIGGRWKTGILYNLMQRPYRFAELRRALGPVTEKMLIQQLRELEGDGLLHRELFPQVPPRVEYSLTHYGRTLGPVLDVLRAWGEQHLQGTAAPPAPPVAGAPAAAEPDGACGEPRRITPRHRAAARPGRARQAG